MNLPTRLQSESEAVFDIETDLPTMYDLPSENPEEPGLPDTFHAEQPQLLDITFHPPNWRSNRIFTGMDLNIYYNKNNPNLYKRPDWFAVVGVPSLYQDRDMRLSYVMWQEKVSPIVVVELLSPGTEEDDLGTKVRSVGSPPTKWEVYEQILQIPHYIVFSRYTNEIQAFQLVNGRYIAVSLTDDRLIIPELQLSIGLWRGVYKRSNERWWLRWFTTDGELIPTPDERAIAANKKALAANKKALAAQQEAATAKQEAATAKQEAATAKQEAERLAARLRELGINPDE